MPLQPLLLPESRFFAWKGETLAEYWWCTERALDFGNGLGPTLIVDDGGDATVMIHRGYEAEKNPAILDKPVDAEDERELNNALKEVLAFDPQRWTRQVPYIKGVSEETTTGRSPVIPNDERRQIVIPGFQRERLGYQIKI